MTSAENTLIERQIRSVLDAREDRFDILVRAVGLDPKRDLRYGDWSDMDFSKADLRGFNFQGSNLTGVCFRGALVEGAIFDEAMIDVVALRQAVDFDLLEPFFDENGRSHVAQSLDLIARVRAYNPRVNEKTLGDAYALSQRSVTSGPAARYPEAIDQVEVARILTKLKADDSTIAAALLQDAVDVTSSGLPTLERRFGPDIAELVAGLSKIKKLNLDPTGLRQRDNLRRFLLASIDDVRVALVVLANILSIMRRLPTLKQKQRAKIADEALYLFAPLAERMGMKDICEELEEHAFKEMNPSAYETICRRIYELNKRNTSFLDHISTEIQSRLAQSGLPARVLGKQKKPYDIFMKMERKSISFEQLSDIFSFRIIVGTINECYIALGVIHAGWSMIPGRFKDYISTPKQNDYRSIHTTVVGPGRQRMEIQIRTEEMDELAEIGVGAFRFYESGGIDQWRRESTAFSFLRRTAEQIGEDDGLADEDDGLTGEYFSSTKLEMFRDQVFCFTPRGMLLALPRGATAIDFAYALHSDIGDTAVGCLINSKQSDMTMELANGDKVQIVVDASATPNPAWAATARTKRARMAIRKRLRRSGGGFTS